MFRTSFSYIDKPLLSNDVLFLYLVKCLQIAIAIVYNCIKGSQYDHREFDNKNR